MQIYIWAVVAFLAVDVIGRMVWLGTGDIPPRTPGMVAWDLAINLAMMISGIVVVTGLSK